MHRRGALDCGSVRGKHCGLSTAPAIEHNVTHAEPAHHFTIAQRQCDETRRFVGETICPINATAGDEFSQQRKRKQNACATQRNPSQKCMLHIAQDDENGCPR